MERCDVIFCGIAARVSQELAAQCQTAGKAFIDLGADFRLEDEDVYREWYAGGIPG